MTTTNKQSLGDSVSKWIAGLMLGIIIAGGGLYAKWINESILQTVYERSVDRQNLDILNAKVDLLLNANKLQYNGPAYHQDGRNK